MLLGGRGFVRRLERYRLGPLFAGHFRTVAYDQRGQGWSDRGPVGVDEWVSDLDVVVKSLHLDRPIVFASSFGTLVGLAYAYSGRDVRAFISQDGRASDFAEPPAGGSAPPSRRVLSSEQRQAYVTQFGAFGPVGVATAHRSILHRPDDTYEVRPTPDDVVAKERAFVELPVLAAYRSVRGPVLMCAADRGSPAREEREAVVDAVVDFAGRHKL